MGLILAALSAAGSTIRDQWKEYFYCDSLPADTICVKASRRAQGFSANRGNDNIITDGSIIAVSDGQCMLIVENGQVVDICAEPGEYRYDSKTEPSIFTGSLGDSVKNVFAQIGKRFTFGGQPSADQRVYYFNTKEMLGVKYGTPAPVPFRVVDTNAGIDVDVNVKCFGEYSLKVSDPILFYTNVCANVKDAYKLSDIEPQLRTELLTALQPAFASISEKGVRYSQVPAHTAELADALNEELSKKWRNLRGIEIVSFGVSSIKADEEDEKRMKELQFNASFKNKDTMSANYAAAEMEALKEAAKNEGGAAMGFYNLNAAQNAGGSTVANLYADMPAAPAPAPAQAGWTCPKCGTVNTGNFCGNCGEKKPGTDKWICPKCGRENTSNFCGNCGEKKPE
ncbi:MAG: SPFH domain-containing protein [Solobacterium sp.]|nr:SPFH domain-containing protein [Solobacterium sp.]